jgi:mercuric ion binding protein
MRDLLRLFLVLGIIAAPIVAHAETITVGVKGMVCSFCAQGIKKSFSRDAVVEKVDVDLDKKLVLITTSKGQNLPDNVIKQTITDAGYEVTDIKRADHD